MNYIRDARARARRRKSAWNLLLLAAVVANFALLTSVGWYAVARLHGFVHPGQSLATSSGVGVILSTISILFASIPISLLLANAELHLFPAARRALDQEAKLVKNTDFRTSQRALSRLALLMVPICLVLATVGAFISWRQ